MKVTQEQAFEILCGIDNCFLTGAGGVGKSYLLKKLMDHFIKYGINYALTSSTGVSAKLINGQTLHSFVGIGISNDLERIVKTRRFKKEIVPRLNELDVLIIDEISMIGAETFDLVNDVISVARKNNQPFGGLKVIVVGDFFQLSPVRDNFCFNSITWKESNFQILNLYKNYRTTNEKWEKLLKYVRIGNITDGVKKALKSLIRYPPMDEDITHILATNKEVDRINNKKLYEIDDVEELYKYSITDTYKICDNKMIHDFFKNSICKSHLKLRVGAYVMIIVNDRDMRYVNGSCGHVVFMADDKVVVKLDDCGTEVEFGRHKFTVEKDIPNPNWGKWIVEDGVSKKDNREFIKAPVHFNQIPLILGWAVTSHKCVSENTKILVKDKGLNLIKDINIGDIVYTGDNFKKCLNKWDSGIKNSYKLLSKSGYELISSNDHKILVFNGEFIFKELKNIDNNDVLCIPRNNIKFFNNLNVEYFNDKRDLGYFLGICVGDGYYNKNKSNAIVLSVTDKKKNILDFVKTLPVNYKEYKSKNTNKTKLMIMDIKFRNYLYDLGLSFTSYQNKHVPHIVYTDVEIIKGFIEGIYDTDGSFKDKFLLSSSCKNIIDDVKLFLSYFGIISNITDIKFEKKTHNISYQLTTSLRQLDLIKNNFNFKVEYKSNQLKNNKIPNRNLYDRIYNISNILLQIRKDIQDVASFHTFKGTKYFKLRDYLLKDSITYDTLKLLIEFLELLKINTNTFNILKDIQNKNYYFDPIISIENQSEVQMYDIEIEDDHQFWADGYIVHNCQGSTLSKAVIDLTNGFTYGQGYVALSRVKTYEGVYLSGMPSEECLQSHPDVVDFVNENFDEFSKEMENEK